MTETVRIVVADTIPADHNPHCGGTELLGLIAWLQERADAIPAEFRNGAVIEIDVEDGAFDVEIYYDRPETFDEALARETAKARSRAQSEEWKRQAEIGKLRELRAKYPND